MSGRALVTGGAGNIGAATTARLATGGYAVTVADLAEPGYIGSGMGGTTVERRLIGQVPLGRAGHRQRGRGGRGFPSQPENRYLTGEIVDVDGGWVPD